MGHTLTVATIHLSLLSYLLAMVCWITGHRGPSYRGLWTAGCVFMFAHAAFAFHFYLGWSHSLAVQLTAEQTQAMLGFRFGKGIWFSYLLLLVWMVDVVRLWRQSWPQGKIRADDQENFMKSAVGIAGQDQAGHVSPSWSWFANAVNAYAFFMLFNGTVVFEDGATRWAGIIGTIWLAWLGWRYRHNVATNARATESSG